MVPGCPPRKRPIQPSLQVVRGDYTPCECAKVGSTVASAVTRSPPYIIPSEAPAVGANNVMAYLISRPTPAVSLPTNPPRAV